MIRQEGRISVDALAAEFDSSAETIRRDLNKLSKAGTIQKIHGGAILPGPSEEGSYQQRMGENAKAKRLAAQKARALISPGESLFIDTGSSTLFFAEEIADISGLTVITNSAEVARVVSSSNCGTSVFLLGGEYNADNRETLGPMTISQLEQFHVHHAVLATGGIDVDVGLMDFDAGEAAVARAMLSRAENVIVLADSSKCGRVAPFVVGGFEQFDYLVCEVEPDHELKEALSRHKVKMI